MIYLDHAATTPLAPEVFEAMLPFLKPDGDYGNPASSHGPGYMAARAVEAARAEVAALIGAEPGEIVWTSGATESNNLAVKGALEFYGNRGRHIVTSRIEHKAVLDTCRQLETQGVRVTYLKPDVRGCIGAQQVIDALQPDTVLVSLMWVNNETGAINEIAALAPLLRARGVLLHVDAVQAAGKLPIDLGDGGIDLLSLSAHKIYGPKGIGALYVRKRPRARLAPQMHGGGHEQGMRSGTLATHQIAGMGAAFRLARERLHDDAARLGVLREDLWQRLQVLPRIHRNGAADATAPHILNVSFEGAEGESLRAMLGDLAVSSGSACSAATREPSYVLRALGRDDELAGSSLRFSLGRGTTAAQIEQAASKIITVVGWLRQLSPLLLPPSPLRGGVGGGGESQVATPPSSPLTQGEDENIFGYSPHIAGRFGAPRHAGELVGEGVIAAESGSRSARALLRLSLRISDGQIREARFRAYGCPSAIAVGEWLAERLADQPVETLKAPDFTAAAIRQALEIAEDRAHCALMGEDVIRALGQQR